MAEDKMVICIAREFGSGGHLIGRTLAEQLGIAFYDKELLRQAAEKSGILPELFEKADEKAAPSFPGDTAEKAASFADYASYQPNDAIQNAIADTIRELAEKSSCVIIGRCADYILRGRPDVFSVFIWAPEEARIHRIARLYNLEEDGARALIRKTDRNRANYYSLYTGRDWTSAESYDLVLNSGRLGPAKTIQILKQAAPVFTSASL